jgi:hypothetical protein
LQGRGLSRLETHGQNTSTYHDQKVRLVVFDTGISLRKDFNATTPTQNAIPLTLGMVTACKAVSRWVAQVEEEERNGQGSGRQLKLSLHKS